jgi:hypothetical protein
MGFLRGNDTISGSEALATSNINGNIQDMFYIKTFEAKAAKIKKEIRTLGSRATQHKSSGWTGTGTMKIHYITSMYRKMMLEYAKTGRDTYFNITTTNEDPTSSVGKQTLVLYGCNIDESILSAIDLEATSLEEDVPFTFDDFDILDEFGKPVI